MWKSGNRLKEGELRPLHPKTRLTTYGDLDELSNHRWAGAFLGEVSPCSTCCVSLLWNVKFVYKRMAPDGAFLPKERLVLLLLIIVLLLRHLI
jgi:hypothetical protein